MRHTFFALVPAYTGLMLASDEFSMADAAVVYAPIENDPYLQYAELDSFDGEDDVFNADYFAEIVEDDEDEEEEEAEEPSID